MLNSANTNYRVTSFVNSLSHLGANCVTLTHTHTHSHILFVLHRHHTIFVLFSKISSNFVILLFFVCFLLIFSTFVVFDRSATLIFECGSLMVSNYFEKGPF